MRSSSWNRSNGPQSARCSPRVGRQCAEVGSGSVRAHHVHLHESARTAVQLEDGDEHDCRASEDHSRDFGRARDTWRTSQCFFLRRIAYQYEVDEGITLSETVTGLEIARDDDQQRRCWKSWETSCSQTVITPNLGEAEFHALQRGAAGALQPQQHISTGWGLPARAIVPCDSTAAIRMSSRYLLDGRACSGRKETHSVRLF